MEIWRTMEKIEKMQTEKEKTKQFFERLHGCRRVLIGLGEEWKLGPEDTEERREKLLAAYQGLYEMIRDKDYFIVTMAVDALIYETKLGSRTEQVMQEEIEEKVSCAAEPELLERMNRIFPQRQTPRDSRWQRIVAPCGNETWRQCSLGCTKDIWEPGEIVDDTCPHCGAPLTGNTIEAQLYIEEGYLPQWQKYTRWLAETWKKELLVLELGVGFSHPSVVRFPFERLVWAHQKAYLYRVNGTFPQVAEEICGRAEGIACVSPAWICSFPGF